ncbi:acyl-CoA N-acyltransferase [Aspergillus aurantiobrunneus]
MQMQIRYAVESDAPALAAINIKAFTGQAFIANAFPGIPYEVVHPLKRARYLQKMMHPQTHVLAAVDESGTVVGCARWVIPADEDGAAKKATVTAMSDAAAAEASAELALPEGTNKAIYEGFFATLKERGRKYLRDDDFVLDFIATHPSFQGRGIAKALLRWGTDAADRAQKRIYLEATPEGQPVYEKSGWRALERVDIEYAPWGGEGRSELMLMLRDPVPCA